MNPDRDSSVAIEAPPPSLVASTAIAGERGRAERGAIAGRAGTVGLGTLLSRVLGLGRDLVLAATFGRADTDLFFVAFTIPNALRQLLAEGALSSAFVPVLATVEEQAGPEAGARFYAKLRGLTSFVLVVTCVAGMLSSRWLCELFAAGFHARPGAFDRTVTLTRMLFPYLFFMGIASLGAGALQTRRRFAVAAFAPALLNVAMIVAALVLPAVLYARGYDPILALAIGALIGGALQVAAQIIPVRRAGFTEPAPLNLVKVVRDPNVREVIRRIGPMTFGLMIYEVDLVLSRRFLSEAGEGANSFFYYAQRLCDFPQGIFSLALATATLPSLAKLAARGDRKELADTFAHALALALFVALPATALLVMLAGPIVIAAFARGAFDATSVAGTSSSLMVQGLGVVLVALVRQLVPLFYALGDTRTPVIVSGLDLLAFIGLAFSLRPSLGHLGVSWAVTGSSFVQAALLVVATHRKLPELSLAKIVPGALKTTVASLAAGGVGATIAWLSSRIHAPTFVRGVLPALFGVCAFAVTFVAVAHLLKSEELAILRRGISRRSARRSA